MGFIVLSWFSVEFVKSGHPRRNAVVATFPDFFVGITFSLFVFCKARLHVGEVVFSGRNCVLSEVKVDGFYR